MFFVSYIGCWLDLPVVCLSRGEVYNPRNIAGSIETISLRFVRLPVLLYGDLVEVPAPPGTFADVEKMNSVCGYVSDMDDEYASSICRWFQCRSDHVASLTRKRKGKKQYGNRHFLHCLFIERHVSVSVCPPRAKCKLSSGFGHHLSLFFWLRRISTISFSLSKERYTSWSSNQNVLL